MSKKKSTLQERKVAKEIKGKPTIASGSLYFQKADVRSEHFLIECKTTDKCYYILKKSIWNKVEKEAVRDSLKIPLLQVDIKDTRLVVLNYYDFIGLDLDKNITILDFQPIKVCAKRYKVTLEFLNAINTKNTQTYYHNIQLKFVDDNTHLIILLWEDFLSLIESRGIL